MRILAVNSARAIWLVNTIFLNPRGRHLIAVVADLLERYRFEKVPDASKLYTRPLELKFEAGSFLSAEGVPISVNLSVHDDGLIAETRASTDESDRFLDDALSWLSERYSLPRYSELGVQKLYVSELFVQLRLPSTIFSDRFMQVIRLLQRGVSNNPNKPMELTALHFGPDPETTKKTAAFRIERVPGTPFRRDEYYCLAPVPTAEHLQLLTELEEATSA